MRSRLSLMICLVGAVLFVAACSSTTVVARDERSAADSATNETDPTAVVADEADADDPDADDPATSEAGEDTPSDLDASAGFGLGGSEQLASLLTDCEAGSDLACDVLFQLSDFESDEETAALTCGGRSETTVTFCTEGIEAAGDDIVFDADSEGLAAVVALCEDAGDMTACDFLYYRSPLDSVYEDIGGTCGGRVSVAVPDCRTFLSD